MELFILKLVAAITFKSAIHLVDILPWQVSLKYMV